MSASAAAEKAQIFATLEKQSAAASRPMRWFVPGRIEVLGKHTDYAGGRSLLCTAERGFCVAAVPRDDALVRITDAAREQSFEFTISPALEVPASTWRLYAAVVARRLARNFPGRLRGADITLASDLPPAAGMSSSSALVIAIFAALSTLNRLGEREEYTAHIRTPEELAEYLGGIENGQTYKSLAGDGGVGTFGGSEDHTAILTSDSGHLKQYSFCPVRLERTVKIATDCAFVIGVSGVVADKIGSAKESYNRASRAVTSILEIWRSVSGSTAPTLAAAATNSLDAPDRIRDAIRKGAPNADREWLVHRFDQFLLESESIIPRACDALARNDLRTFGELVDQSQAATESLLRNQVPETIWLAKEARRLGAIAASALGAGFGGSVWALVASESAAEFARRWQQAYEASPFPARVSSQFFVTAAGPHIIQLC
jgi:galactokinase